jgi:hypothetical protein
MLRLLFVFSTLALLGSAPAGAQSQPSKDRPNNSAVNSADQNNSNSPVAGRNSFTQGQAKSRIEAAGYSNISNLQKDNDGIWRGKAQKGGNQTEVTLDFQGNVNASK